MKVFNPVDQILNPINYRRLPKDFRDLTLDYRSDPVSPKWKLTDTLFAIVIMMVAAFGLTAIVRLGGPVLATVLAFAAATVVSFVIAVVYFVVTRRLKKAVAILCCGALVPGVLAGLHYATNYWEVRAAALVIACALVAWLADAMADHYVQWLLANPRLSRKTRQERAKWWKSRKRVFLSKYTGEEGEDEAVRKRRRKDLGKLRMYKLRFLFPAVFLVALLPGWLPVSYLIFIVPGIVAVFFLVTVRYPIREVIRLTGRAAVSWLTYGRYTVPAPGVWGSPAGRRSRRFAMSFGVVVFLAIALLPSVAYMPLVFHAQPGGIWEDLFAPIKAKHASSPKDIQRNDSKIYYARDLGVDLMLHVEDKEGVAPHWYSWIVGEPKIPFGKRLQDRWEDEVNAARFVAAEPENWLVLAGRGASAGNDRCVWAFILAGVGSFVLPPFVVGCSFLAVAGTTLIRLYDALEGDEAYEAGERRGWTTWAHYAKRLEESPHEKEREHLWLGVHRDEDYPLILDSKILSEHAYIVGDSGSGKTALGITPIISQLIQRTDHGVVLIDLKGDNALFQAAREESQAAGRTFKWFTNELGRSSYVFNPFAQHKDLEHVSVNQICETMLEALNLNHGEGYGRSYFSRVARRWLAGTLRTHSKVSSFEELYELAASPENFRDDKEKEDAFELLSVVESLATFQQLNAAEGEHVSRDVIKNAIQMPEVIAEGQIAYFWLPAAAETATVREIGKLALYALITSAYRHVREHGEAKQTYLVIDEFQRIASDGFKLILQQARSMGVGAILANQTTADLKTNDSDLGPTVQTNTRFKWCFSASDTGQQDQLITASGETVYHLKTHHSDKVSTAETVRPRITRNDVIRTSDDPFESIVQVSRGSGYTQLSGFSIPLVTSYHITAEIYQERNKKQWPEANEHTVVAKRPPMDPERFISAEDRLKESKIILEEDAVGEGAAVPEIRVTVKEPPAKKKGGKVASMLSQMKAEHEGEDDDA